jgi:hypothetical protein
MLHMFCPCSEFDTKHCRGESIQTDEQQRELRLNGSTLGNNKCPNFFSWFKSHVIYSTLVVLTIFSTMVAAKTNLSKYFGAVSNNFRCS